MLPGGWGSWNIIGWVLIAIVVAFALFLIGCFLVGAWQGAKSGWRKGMQNARCQRGRHAPGIRRSEVYRDNATRDMTTRRWMSCSNCEAKIKDGWDGA